MDLPVGLNGMPTGLKETSEYMSSQCDAPGMTMANRSDVMFWSTLREWHGSIRPMQHKNVFIITCARDKNKVVNKQIVVHIKYPVV